MGQTNGRYILSSCQSLLQIFNCLSFCVLRSDDLDSGRDSEDNDVLPAEVRELERVVEFTLDDKLAIPTKNASNGESHV